jgi:hypothetical protein
MESKGINSPYVVALISGLVLGFGCELLMPLTEFDVSTGFFEFILPFVLLILLFAIVQQVLKHFFGFQGFVISGDNGRGKRLPSYTLFFLGYFASEALAMLITIGFLGSSPN